MEPGGPGWNSLPGTGREEAEMATRKTPAQRAQDDYDVALRVLEKATARAEKTAADDKKAQEDAAAAKRRVAFLGTHPDLPPQDGDGAPAAPEADNEAETVSDDSVL